MKIFNFKKPPPKDELYVRDIVDKLLLDKDVKKRIAPLSSTVYLEKDDYLVRINYLNNRVVFFDGTIPYKKDISSHLTNSLIEKCKKKIEEEMQELDKLIYEEEIDFLKKILKKYE